MRLADRVIKAGAGDKTTNLELAYYPLGVREPACVYASMWENYASRELFVEMTISDAYLLAMMLNEALGLEVKG